MIKISVIIPVFNVEKYLDCCIQSLVKQTVQCYEIILVDDGSTDRCAEICDHWAEKTDIIKVIHKQNAGLGMARNSGLEIATGEYIIFIDSDDFCDSDFIERICAIVENYNCDTCKTIFRRVDLQGNKVSEEKIEKELFIGAEIKEKLIPRMIGSSPEKHDSLPMSTCSTLYSMDIIKKHNLRFCSEREWISEDILFNIAYFAYSQKTVISDYIGYNYRINPKSLSTSYREDRFEQFIKLYHKEKEILLNIGIWENSKYRLSRQFFVYLTMCFSQLKNCPLSFQQKLENIRSACQHQETKRMIMEYPVNLMGFKQKIFIMMVKHSWTFLIWACYCI